MEGLGFRGGTSTGTKEARQAQWTSGPREDEQVVRRATAEAGQVQGAAGLSCPFSSLLPPSRSYPSSATFQKEISIWITISVLK